MQTLQTQTNSPNDPAQTKRVTKAIKSASFAVLSTVSAAGFPHAAGVVYETAEGSLFVHTMGHSRKAQNVRSRGRVGVVIPVRKLPVGPPFTIQFQATAEVFAMDDKVITDLLSKGELKGVTGHGALDEPDGCFLRLTPSGRIHTYGIGVSAIALARDPLHAGARSLDAAQLSI